MKKHLLFLMFVMLPLVTNAETVEINGIYYELDSDAKTAEVTRNSCHGDVIIPSNVIYSGVDYRVTSIVNRAFEGCSSLTSIVIPNSVTSIGDLAFYRCSGLTSIIVEAGNNTYDSRNNCNAIIETMTNRLIRGSNNTIIPNSVTSIGDYAFDSCSSLNSVTIPNSVTNIGRYSFAGCKALASITIPNSVTSIGEAAFDNSGLTSITIPNSVTSIEDLTFYNCKGLTSVTISNSVTSIGMYAFGWCSSLTSITIPNSVTSIGSSAFFNCTGLTSVAIGSGVTSIGNYAFQNCSNLTSVTIGSGVTSIGNYAFEYCSSLSSVSISNSVTSIGNYAFHNCSNLTSVTIPNSVTSIGERAFSWCSSLISVTIGSGVRGIGAYAFYGENIHIVVSLIENPFAIYGKTSSNLVFNSNTFDYATLYVPSGTIYEYRTTNGWKDFEHIVEGIPSGISTSKMEKKVVTKSYTIDGKVLDKPQKGLNIVKMSDGTTRKVVVK